MAKHYAHPSPLETSSYEFYSIPLEDNVSQDELNDCKDPPIGDENGKTARRITAALIWVGILALASLIGLTVAVIVKFAVTTDNKGFDHNSPEYALYKNSRFKDCYDSHSPVANNCTDIKSILRSPLDNYRHAQNITRLTYAEINNDTLFSETLYDWCDLVSCFKGFKVIPTSLHRTAFFMRGITSSVGCAMVFLTAMWLFKMPLKKSNRDRRERCKKIEWDFWVILAWDLASIIWWWINFARYLYEPTQFPTPGVFNWVSLWKYGFLIDVHPYSCALQNTPIIAWITKWTLNVLIFVQWLASGYIWLYTTDYSVSSYPTYDCLASQIPTAPGTSTCSPSQICSRDSLFYAYPIEFSSDSFHDEPNAYLPFLLLTVAFLYGIASHFVICWILPICRAGSFKENRKIAREQNPGSYIFLLVFSFCSIALMVLVSIYAMKAAQRGRETGVTVDWDCNAVHVTLSPWRFYFDVQYQLPIRLAQTLFNV